MKADWRNWIMVVGGTVVSSLLLWIGSSLQSQVNTWDDIKRNEPNYRTRVDSLWERSQNSWQWKKAFREAHERDSIAIHDLRRHR